LQLLFNLCHDTLYSLSLNFNIDNNEFYQLFIPIFQNYVYSNLNTLHLKNPTKETLNYLLVSTPYIKYLCQDNYTNSFYVTIDELFSLDKSCQNNIKHFYYCLGEPLNSSFKRYLKGQNLGLWRVILNNNENDIINVNEKNSKLSKLIRSYSNVLSINLSQNMNNDTLISFSPCSHLMELQLNYGDFTSFGLCQYFSSNKLSFNNLSVLSLEYCPGVNDEVVNAITQHCSKLSTLSVNGCKWVTDCSMKYISQRLTQLKKLELSGTRLTSVGLWNLAPLYYLFYLNLNQCYNLSLEGLIEFIKTTYSYFFSVSCLSNQEKYKNGCIGMDDSLFYDINEELNNYASNEIEKLKELQNNYKIHQMQNDISLLNISSNKKKGKYQQRSISNIFLSFAKK